MDYSMPCSSVHGDSPGKNTEVGCCALLQGSFPTQGLNPGLPHCRQILYCLSHQGTLRILEWVAYPFSRGSSWLRNWTGVSCIADGFFTSGATREAPVMVLNLNYISECPGNLKKKENWFSSHISRGWDLELGLFRYTFCRQWFSEKARRPWEKYTPQTVGGPSQKAIGIFLNDPQCLITMAAAAAESLQSCPTLCDPIDGSPPGSPVPGILQARTLEWVLQWLLLIKRTENGTCEDVEKLEPLNGRNVKQCCCCRKQYGIPQKIKNFHTI